MGVVTHQTLKPGCHSLMTKPSYCINAPFATTLVPLSRSAVDVERRDIVIPSGKHIYFSSNRILNLGYSQKKHWKAHKSHCFEKTSS